MSILSKLSQAKGQGVSEETLSLPQIPVSFDAGGGNYLPHENIFLIAAEVVQPDDEGKAKGFTPTLALTFQLKELDDMGNLRVVGQSKIFDYCNISSRNTFENKNYTAEEIFRQMLQLQEKYIHIASAFHKREDLAFDMFLNIPVTVEQLGQQIEENDFMSFKSYIDEVYNTCAEWLANVLNHESTDLSQPLKVKFSRQSADKARPTIPTYLTFWNNQGTMEEIQNPFISTMADVQKCLAIKYNSYEKGIRKSGPAGIDRSNPNEKAANKGTQSSQANRFGGASTTSPTTKGEAGGNPFAKK